MNTYIYLILPLAARVEYSFLFLMKGKVDTKYNLII